MKNPEYAKVGDKKYKINTDYMTAIECNEIAQDQSIGDYERALAIIYKLYGEDGLSSCEDYDKLLEIGQRYLLLGKDIKSIETKNKEPDMDYIQDMGLIKASFMSDFGIDLDKNQDMHWWSFSNYLNGLSNSEFGNCCVLNRVRNIRNMNLSDIKDPKEREKVRKAKEEVALKTKEIPRTEEEEESVRKFYELIGRKEE